MADLTRDQLLQMIGRSEDNFVERKPAKGDPRQFRRTIVAFANSVPEGRCAVLFIGVRDDGTVEGCPNPDEQQKAVRSACSDCYPPIDYRAEALDVDGKQVVAIVVPASSSRPHFAGTAFVRQGSESITAPAEMFDALVHSRNSKVAALQKLVGHVCSVIGLGHRLGDTRRDVGRDYREGGDGLVLAVDPHTIRIQMLGSGTFINEPLEHVTLTRDEAGHRPRLVVTGY